jgi:hypothetical protein
VSLWLTKQSVENYSSGEIKIGQNVRSTFVTSAILRREAMHMAKFLALFIGFL